MIGDIFSYRPPVSLPAHIPAHFASALHLVCGDIIVSSARYFIYDLFRMTESGMEERFINGRSASAAEEVLIEIQISNLFVLQFNDIISFFQFFFSSLLRRPLSRFEVKFVIFSYSQIHFSFKGEIQSACNADNR